MPMPSRQRVGGELYRYAFQGQEKDTETDKEAFQLRLWDGRIGRWLTTDPMGQYHSPYMAMDNRPNMSIDPTGGCTECPDNAKNGDRYNHSYYGNVTYDGSGWSNAEFGNILNDALVGDNWGNSNQFNKNDFSINDFSKSLFIGGFTLDAYEFYLKNVPKSKFLLGTFDGVNVYDKIGLEEFSKYKSGVSVMTKSLTALSAGTDTYQFATRSIGAANYSYRMTITGASFYAASRFGGLVGMYIGAMGQMGEYLYKDATTPGGFWYGAGQTFKQSTNFSGQEIMNGFRR